jgi:hypothetical protein
VPKVKGILGFVVNGKVADDKTSNLSSKDRRMLKMLEEELVDPDRMTLSKNDKKGVSNVHKDGVIGGLRRGDNTLDLTKCISETHAQESANKFIEKMIDNRETIVILGSGWGSHAFLKTIDGTKYNVKVISPRSYFTFTPMLAASAVGTVDFRSICAQKLSVLLLTFPGQATSKIQWRNLFSS